MVDAAVWAGVEYFVSEYVKPRSSDFVVVAYTPDSREIAGLVCVALKSIHVPLSYVCMAPIRDDGFLARLKAAMIQPHELNGQLIILTFERDTMSHDKKLKEALRHFDKERYVVFRAISSCAELFSSALRASPQEIDTLNSTLLRRTMNANKLHIETPGGSAIDVQLDNAKHQWVSNRGISRPGRIVILPAGEIATYPANVTGKFVADFAFNLNAITDRDTRLTANPITVTLKDGRAVDYECEDTELEKFLDQCFRKYCASNVGELGFGTNRMVNIPIAMNSHINERKPGVHLGFGQHNQDRKVVPYQCDLHLDLVAEGGLLWIDDDKDPIDLANFPAVDISHPPDFRDEDVFSPNLDDLEVEDCCGILKKGEMKLFKIES